MKLTEFKVQQAIHRDIVSRCIAVMPNFTPRGWWECDVCAVTNSGYFTEYEIKLTASDLRADADKHVGRYRTVNGAWKYVSAGDYKHDLLRQGHKIGPSSFYYVVPPDLAELVPAWAGVMVATATGYGARLGVRRKAPQLHRHKVDRGFVDLMRRSAEYRYWKYREDKCASQHPTEEPSQQTTSSSTMAVETP
jgi:hypothetical protein